MGFPVGIRRKNRAAHHFTGNHGDIAHQMSFGKA
jgi:hypothetical protein